MILRIALIGPESTAKSTLSEQLARHYNTLWVPEYARTYLENMTAPYTKDDVLAITRGQLKSEEEKLKQANKLLFADTELIIASVWLIDKFGDCPQWINDKILKYEYDLYLLTRPDLPFEDDPLRENPLRREFFFDWYRRELEDRDFNYRIVEGENDARLKNAIRFTDELISGKHI